MQQNEIEVDVRAIQRNQFCLGRLMTVLNRGLVCFEEQHEREQEHYKFIRHSIIFSSANLLPCVAKWHCLPLVLAHLRDPSEFHASLHTNTLNTNRSRTKSPHILTQCWVETFLAIADKWLLPARGFSALCVCGQKNRKDDASRKQNRTENDQQTKLPKISESSLKCWRDDEFGAANRVHFALPA